MLPPPGSRNLNPPTPQSVPKEVSSVASPGTNRRRSASFQWLRVNLPSQIRALGVPVTEVIGTDSPLTPLSAA